MLQYGKFYRGKSFVNNKSELSNLELIIVDGKSTDRTLEIISKYDNI
jgi:glycosyltransferase involved in cell wall biosynthesis